MHTHEGIRRDGSARLQAFRSSREASCISELPHKEDALVTHKTSENLARVQSRHCDCHFSQVPGCADMPIKEKITLFFPHRAHTAIRAEQKSAGF